MRAARAYIDDMAVVVFVVIVGKKKHQNEKKIDDNKTGQ